jgi:phenylacetate-CoA ligase
MSALSEFLLWRTFEKQQWLSPAALEQHQNKRLRAMLRGAYSTVPYYHQLFREHGIRPESITMQNLATIPILSKKAVRKHGADLRSRAIPQNQMRFGATTGSTGIPLTIGHDAISRAAGKAVMLRAMRAHGVRLTDTVLRITHRPHKQTLRERLGILPILTASVYSPPAQLAREMQRIKPDVIDAYPSVLHAMASCGEALPRVRRVFSTTEMLTEEARNRIQDAFHAQVIDVYGAAEFPRLAWQCPEGSGYHIDSDYAVVQRGEHDELIVTGLYNQGMPLIRYAIGDRAVFSDEQCACGRGLPLLERIEGRTDDLLVMPNGEHVSPRRVNVLDGIAGVDQYRIVQTGKDRITAEVVPAGRWSDALAQDVIARISAGLPNHDVVVSAKPVSALPRGPGGKIRTVVSHVRA